MEGQENVFRAYGAREILTGVGFLSAGNEARWVWGRVAGDALDLATLARGLDPGNPKRRNVQLAMAAVAGVTALDVFAGSRLGAQGNGGEEWSGYGDRSGFSNVLDPTRGVGGWSGR